MGRSYEQFCPIARTLDVVGERWNLLILRQVLNGPQRFTDLRDALGGVSPTLLRDRLADLQAHGIVERIELGPPASRFVYQATPRGAALEPVLYELARWGLPLLDAPTEREPLLPQLIQPGIKALCRTEAVPDGPLTVALALDEGDYTLVVAEPLDDLGASRRPVDRLRVTLGLPDEPDATVKGALVVLLWLRRGDLDLKTARADHLVTIEGRRAAVAQVEDLLGLHGTAEFAAAGQSLAETA